MIYIISISSNLDSWIIFKGLSTCSMLELFIFNNVGLSERNNYRLAPYHRLDLNLNWYRSNRKGRQSIWSFGLYNAYASPNAFMTELEMYLGPDGKLSPRLKKTVLFFCVPSVSYTFKF